VQSVDQMLGNGLVRLGLANEIGIFTAIATDPICALAFIHKIAMAIAFSELRLAFRTYPAIRVVTLCGMSGIVHRQQNRNHQHRCGSNSRTTGTPLPYSHDLTRASRQLCLWQKSPNGVDLR
jgi:hypothetical protein